MKRLLAIVPLVLLATTPAAAADRPFSIIASAQFYERTAETSFDEQVSDTTFDLSFESGGGGGFGLGIPISDYIDLELKTSLVVSRAEISARTSDSVVVLDAGRVKSYATTAVLQYFFPMQGDWDPYVGAGASYAFVDEVDAGIATIEFEGNIGFVVNGGVDIALSDRFGVNLDAKYVPFETRASGTSREGNITDLGVEPLILSAGLRYKF